MKTCKLGKMTESRQGSPFGWLRWAGAALCLALVLILFPTVRAAQSSGTCGDLTWVFDESTKTLTISGQGRMATSDWPFSSVSQSVENLVIQPGATYIGEQAFESFRNLKSVSIPGTVEVIDDFAFYGCGSLERIVIPEGVQEIGDDIFVFCNKLKDVSLPQTLTYIGSYAFRVCTALEEITIPSHVNTVGSYAFDGCSNLKRVTLEDGVKRICSSAFNGCDIIRLDIPGSVEVIEETAFRGNDHLESLIIRHGVKEIKSRAFEQCDALKTVTLPGSVQCVWGGAFPNELEEVIVLGWNTQYTGGSFGMTPNPFGRTATIYGFAGSPTESLAKKGGNPFIPLDYYDVLPHTWYFDTIKTATEWNLFHGVETHRFAPNGTMSRAMLVAVLWRSAGAPEPEQEATFVDVPQNSYYAKAVAWSAEQGIVRGVSADRFDPNSPITREQLAAILYRYTGVLGADRSQRGDLSGFPDQGQVSPYAKEAMEWAVGTELILGADGKLMPRSSATRAQTATIVVRFLNAMGEEKG